MTKGIGSWGWSTVPQKHLKDRVLRYHAGQGDRRRVVDQRADLHARRARRLRRVGAATKARAAGRTGMCCPTSSAPRTTSASPTSYHAYGGPLGVSNPISPLPICEAFFQAGQELGIPFNPDFNGARQEGLGYYQLTQLDARRSSTSVAYLNPIRDRTNLHVMLQTQVLRVRRRGRRAVGVEIVERRQPHAAGRARRARGDRLLGRDRLAQAADAVGHRTGRPSACGRRRRWCTTCRASAPTCRTISTCSSSPNAPATTPTTSTASRTTQPGPALQYLLLRKGPVASSLFETGGFWYADRRRARSPDIQFHLGLGSGIEAGVAKMKQRRRHAELAPTCGHARAARCGWQSADPDAAPLIDPNYWADPQDKRAGDRRPAPGARDHAAAGAQALRAGGGPAGARQLQTDAGAVRLRLRASRRPTTIRWAPAASGRRPIAMSVVTPDLRVHRPRGPARRRRLGDAARALVATPMRRPSWWPRRPPTTF